MCRGGVYVRHEYLLFGRGRPYRRDRIEGNFGKVAERLAIGQPGEPRRLGNVGQDRPVAGAQLRMALGAQPRPRRIDVRLPFTVDQDMADRDPIGRAACREMVYTYWLISGVAASLTQKQQLPTDNRQSHDETKNKT